jgi:hypothetical protein
MPRSFAAHISDFVGIKTILRTGFFSGKRDQA